MLSCGISSGCNDHSGPAVSASADAYSSIAVIIPCFNHVDFLKSAILSVEEQSQQPDLIVVVDDGSTDGSGTIARALMSTLTTPLWVMSTENRGLSAARNLGVVASGADCFLPLDADDRLMPNAIQRLSASYASRLAVAVVPDIVSVGPNVGQWRRPVYEPTMERRRNLLPYCGLICTDAWNSVGRYDEALFGYEDWSLWIALGQVGDIHQIPDKLLEYRYSNTGLLGTAIKNDLENRARIVKRYQPLYSAIEVRAASEILFDGVVSKTTVTSFAPDYQGIWSSVVKAGRGMNH